MARPREFDIDEALDRAMDVFWAEGYQGASLMQLLDAMGIARGSLYKAFKDKHSIYLAALDRYDRTVVQAAVDMLGDPAYGSGAARVHLLLSSASDAVALRNDRRGCFFCNAAIDQAPQDPEVASRVLAMTKRLERAIAGAIAAGRAGDADGAASGARLLVNTYVGLRVLAKMGYPPPELNAMIGAAMAHAGLAPAAAATA